MPLNRIPFLGGFGSTQNEVTTMKLKTELPILLNRKSRGCCYKINCIPQNHLPDFTKAYRSLALNKYYCFLASSLPERLHEFGCDVAFFIKHC